MASYAAQLSVLVLATMVLLFGPKLLAVLTLLEDVSAARAHGGAAAVIKSALAEAIFSTLMAPIVMLQHSWYVVSILMGLATGWNAQTRSDHALPLGLVARIFAIHTGIGLAATFLLWRYAPGSFDWFVPLLAGLWLAIPLVALSSSPRLGLATRREGLFLVPSETHGLKVLNRAHALAGSHEDVSDTAQQLVLDDMRVRDLHLALLGSAHMPGGDSTRLDVLRAQAARRETSDFSRDDWALLLSDSEGLRALP